MGHQYPVLDEAHGMQVVGAATRGELLADGEGGAMHKGFMTFRVLTTVKGPVSTSFVIFPVSQPSKEKPVALSIVSHVIAFIPTTHVVPKVRVTPVPVGHVLPVL